MGTIYTFQKETDLDSIADADKLLIYDASTGLTKSITATDLKVYAGNGLVNAAAAPWPSRKPIMPIAWSRSTARPALP